MKLQPKFNVQEYRDRYVLLGSIPGMKTDDINIELSDDAATITLEGYLLCPFCFLFFVFCFFLFISFLLISESVNQQREKCKKCGGASEDNMHTLRLKRMRYANSSCVFCLNK